jgi:hypothetical protein
VLKAEKKVWRRVRKSHQKEAAGAAGAGLMQIECGEITNHATTSVRKTIEMIISAM